LRTWVYLFVALVVAAGFGLRYFSKNFAFDIRPKNAAEAAPNGNANSDEPTPVRTVAATRGSVDASVDATANLRALRNITILSRSEGVVQRVAAEEGDFVRSGQILCQLDDRELQVDLELARQRLAQTRVQLERAQIVREKMQTQVVAKKTDLKRNEDALAEGLVSDTDVALVRNQLAELSHDERSQEASVRENQFRVEELQAEIEKVELRIAHAKVTAPFTGTIVKRSIDLGQSVRASDELFDLAAFSPLYADVFLSEAESRAVKPGQVASISLDISQAAVAGRIVRISPVVDDETGTVKVTAEIQSPTAQFRPGAFVRVNIKTDTVLDAVLIPKSAVIERDGETFVFVTDNDVAHKKTVQLGYEDGASVEVRAGLGQGELVVVAGQGSLEEGEKTSTVEL
jgi:membrane fusion protein (multidrug efflux system)